MANFAGHITAGAAVSVAAGCAMFYFRNVLADVSYPAVVPVLCAGVLFGSLYPDTDIKSKSGWICNVFLLLIGLLCAFYFKQYYIAALPLAMFLIPIFVKHRGLCHDIRYHLVLSFLMVVISFIFFPLRFFAAGYIIGVIVHLGLDSIGSRFLRGLAIFLLVCFAAFMLIIIDGKDYWDFLRMPHGSMEIQGDAGEELLLN
ncbi:MAG: metal-dependent hydrolase [Treponema sp.]|nr:metal-dependent hydrolase [Treponema sp.]